jgi:predicted RNA binding protein YcfA (HicA-like mRNA interferase family)
MSKKNLRDCKSGKDFHEYCSKQDGVEIRNGKGSHFKVVTDKGIVVAPYHNKDLGKGIWNAIFKGLLRIGIMGFISLFIYMWMYG